MNNGFIISTYIERFFVIIVIIWSLKGVFNRKTNVNPKFVKKHNKKIDIIARVLLIVVIIVSIPLLIVPAILDIPYVIEGKYETMQCMTISQSIVGDVIKRRGIQVLNLSNNKMIELKVHYTPLYKNEYYTINYLPHLRIGEIVNK